MDFKKNLGISISVGIVGAAWTLIAGKLGLLAWPAFIGWTLYFYGGANLKSIKNGLPCMFLGTLLAFLSIKISVGPLASGFLVFVPGFLLSFLMTYAQNLSIFSVCPATFLGSILYFSTGGSFFYSVFIASIGVIVLGIASTSLGAFLENLINDENRPIIS